MAGTSHPGDSVANSSRQPGSGWGFARVTGRSMLPTLRAGDRLFVHYGRPPQPGDLVIAQFVDGTVAIKRAVEQRTLRTGEPGWWLLSDNPNEGVDSRHRGPVAAARVWGVVRALVPSVLVAHLDPE